MPPKRVRKRKRRRRVSHSSSSSSSSPTPHPGTSDVATHPWKLPSSGGGANPSLTRKSRDCCDCSSSSEDSTKDSVKSEVASPECNELPESRHPAMVLSRPTRGWSRSHSPTLHSNPPRLSRVTCQAVNRGDQASEGWVEDLRMRFQRYWMASITNTFEGNLEKLRQVCPFLRIPDASTDFTYAIRIHT